MGSRKASGQAGQESISRSEAGNAASHLEEILFDLGTDLLESSLVCVSGIRHLIFEHLLDVPRGTDGE